MGKLFKDKKTRGRNLLLILIPLIILVIVFSVLAFNSVKGLIGGATGSGTASYSNSIDEYDYHLRSNATDLQKELFAELKEELKKSEAEKDESKISVLIAKNFVADFYTWTNKSGTTDVGGLYYVYSPNRRAILFQSRKYMYQHLNEYIKQYGQKNLLEVNGFGENPQVSKGTVEINGNTYPTWDFVLKWTYAPSSGGFDNSKYATSSWFRVYKNGDGRYEILDIGE